MNESFYKKLLIKKSGFRLAILCPLFFGSGSGVATYYQLLTDNLYRRGIHLIIISDKEKGTAKGKYYSLFPRRCAQDRNHYKDLLAYGIQNFLYFRLLSIIRNEKPDSLLVHSSFYNHPGLFRHCMMILRKNFRGRMIADVRDQLMPADKIHQLNIFDTVISCSMNVMDYLKNNNVKNEKIVHIPVIQEHLSSEEKFVKQLLLKYGIVENKYLFYAGLVKEEKGVLLLLQTFCNHLQGEGLKLVLAGYNKLKSAEAKNLIEHPEVLYIGNQDRNTILALMSKAALCANLSFSEGMPRASLEAIDLGRPVILPKGIPEFDLHCPGYVVKEMKPQIVAQQIRTILSSKGHPNYPIEAHRLNSTIDRYFEVLFGSKTMN